MARASAAAPTLKAIRNKQTKSEILGAIADETGLTRVQVKSVLIALGDTARRHIMKRGSGEFSVPELGVKVRRVQRKARMGRNPQTGEPVKIPAKTAIRATVLKPLKSMLD